MAGGPYKSLLRTVGVSGPSAGTGGGSHAIPRVPAPCTPPWQSRSHPVTCLGGCAKDGLIETPRLNLPCAIPGNGKHQPIRVAKKLERASNLPKQNKPATDT